MKTSDADLGTIRILRKNLDELRAIAFENFEALESDLQSIKALDSDDPLSDPRRQARLRGFVWFDRRRNMASNGLFGSRSQQ